MLERKMIQNGEYLFARRSYLPFLLLLVIVPAVAHFHYLFDNHVFDEVLDLAAVAVSFTGLVVRVLTVGFVPKGTSGRNTRRLKADALNTTGMYSLLRHPLYVGNFLIYLGLLVFLHNLLLFLVITLVFWFYYERIMLAEEAYLAREYGETFTTWAERTPAVFPAFQNWTPPNMRFCWKTVLRREHSTLLAIAVAFSTLEVVAHIVVERAIGWEIWWMVLLCGSLVVSGTVQTLKKRTTLLHVRGR